MDRCDGINSVVWCFLKKKRPNRPKLITPTWFVIASPSKFLIFLDRIVVIVSKSETTHADKINIVLKREWWSESKRNGASSLKPVEEETKNSTKRAHIADPALKWWMHSGVTGYQQAVCLASVSSLYEFLIRLPTLFNPFYFPQFNRFYRWFHLRCIAKTLRFNDSHVRSFSSLIISCL